MKPLFYCGIGSRETPREIIEIIFNIAQQLTPRWTLRSGFADGADQAFMNGAKEAGGRFINYLPWEGFNNAPRHDYRWVVPKDWIRLFDLADEFHPAWDRCSQEAKKLHARNGCQVLGENLETPVKMVICWTSRGLGGGGTGQAIRIAKAHKIPVFDLGKPDIEQPLSDFIDKMESENV